MIRWLNTLHSVVSKRTTDTESVECSHPESDWAFSGTFPLKATHNMIEVIGDVSEKDTPVAIPNTEVKFLYV